MAPDLRRLYSPKVVAGVFGVHEKTVYRWIDEGAIEGVHRIGRSVFVDLAVALRRSALKRSHVRRRAAICIVHPTSR